MTENNLNNGEAITNSTESNTGEVKTAEPELTFTKDMYDPKSGVTATGAKKMIHEVIDMTNPPEKIKVNDAIAIKKEITD